MQDHERVRYLARNFGDLQGLKGVLAGSLFLAMVPSNVSGSIWGLVLLTLALLTVGPLWLLVDRYYERTFGRVRSARGTRSLSWWLVSAVAVLAVVVLAVLETLMQPTVSLLALGGVLIALSLWYSGRPFKAYYLVVFAILVGVALLPLTGVLPSERSLQFNSAMSLGMTGAVMIFGGVMDHRWLVRNMKPLPEEGDGSTV